jgi:aryl-alcohol dehydrogenase-like predicted oxidoreductase
MGYGAMQLAGPGVWGPPRDPDGARVTLRTVVGLGINHIDTSDYYGPYTVNELIRETLAPYPDGLHIVTKIGAKRAADRSWPAALSRDDLTQAVHDNLERLGLPALDVVNLRMPEVEDPAGVVPPFTVLAGLREQGLIRHLGVSNVGLDELRAVRDIAPVVCVQNMYNVALRGDDPLVDYCAENGIAFVPFFPLGGFRPLQSDTLNTVAAGLGITPMQTALAWLLHRSPTILLIPGTSSVAHLRENVAAAAITLPDEALKRLDAIGS